jgi:ATP-binding cassette subfamily F protein 3
MIRLQNLTLQRGPQRLLEDAELTLHAGHKAGLIGANGAGKSSLFALLRGELHPDSGDCLLPADWRIAHMRQEVDTSNAWRSTMCSMATCACARCKRPGRSRSGPRRCRSGPPALELDSADGYTADARARKLLAGLGFTNEQMDRQVGDFSGGWRMRLNLAQALMCPSDLLLLDEPTNHWTSTPSCGWKSGSKVTRHLAADLPRPDFLDAVVDHVAHVDQRKITLYRGGYSAFERARAERLAQQQQAYEKQQAQRAHMESYIARFKAQATKARQAQSRIKALERMEELTAAHVDSPFDFVFRESQKISSPLIDLSDARLGYGDKTILEKVKLQLTPGARIGLLGPNGAGKSTLIKNLRVNSAAGRPPDPWREHGCRLLRPASARLAGLQGQPAAAPAASGADRARADPARLPRRLRLPWRADRRAGAEFLRWRKGASGPGADRLGPAEPVAARRTDQPPRPGNAPGADHGPAGIQWRGAGGLHDRHLLKSTTDNFYLVADGKVEEFDGDLDDYARWLVEYRQRNAPVSTTPVNPDKTDKKAQRQAAAALRQQLAPHKRADKLEAELGKVHEKLAKIDASLGDSDIYEPARKDELRDLLAEQAKLKVAKAELEEAWMEALELLESMQAELEALS